MKKILITMILGVIGISSFAQIGINTKLPMHPFHFDGKGNNPASGAILDTQEKDDFVITKEGNVGIGVINPTERLHVVGSFRYVDGNQSDKKVLMSDSNGIARLTVLPEPLPTVIGSFVPNTGKVINVSPKAGASYSNSNITLKKGKWIVHWGLALYNTSASNFALSSYLSSSQTNRTESGFVFLGNPIVKPSIRIMIGPNKNIIQGTSIVDVTAESTIIYVLLQNDGGWTFESNEPENYLYASPLM